MLLLKTKIIVGSSAASVIALSSGASMMLLNKNDHTTQQKPLSKSTQHSPSDETTSAITDQYTDLQKATSTQISNIKNLLTAANTTTESLQSEITQINTKITALNNKALTHEKAVDVLKDFDSLLTNASGEITTRLSQAQSDLDSATKNSQPINKMIGDASQEVTEASDAITTHTTTNATQVAQWTQESDRATAQIVVHQHTNIAVPTQPKKPSRSSVQPVRSSSVSMASICELLSQIEEEEDKQTAANTKLTSHNNITTSLTEAKASKEELLIAAKDLSDKVKSIASQWLATRHVIKLQAQKLLYTVLQHGLKGIISIESWLISPTKTEISSLETTKTKTEKSISDQRDVVVDLTAQLSTLTSQTTAVGTPPINSK